MTNPAISTVPMTGQGALARLRETLRKHYTALGARSRRLRFLMQADDDRLAVIAGRARPDEVLTLTIDEGVHGVLEIFETGNHHAEIGLSIEDDYQGMGYGRTLFARGLEAARRRGVRTAELFFSAENVGVRRLVEARGGTIRRQGADCEAQVRL